MEKTAAAPTKMTVQTFEYLAGADEGPAEAPFWEDWVASEESAAEEEVAPPTSSEPPPPVDPVQLLEARLRGEFEQRLAAESKKSFDVGRERGRQEGIAEGRQAENEAQMAARAEGEQQRRNQMAELLNGFAQQRDHYLQAVEREVVELALAVAARILRREAQMDPLLLSGAVRVALGQLSATTKVRLRVPASELELWREALATIPNLALRPEVVAGENMRLGDCRIETDLGSVDLGIRSQLAEIERGFFDRAAGAARAAREPDEGTAPAGNSEGAA